MRILWLSHFLPYPAFGHGALQRTHRLLIDTAAAHEVGLVALVPGAKGGPRALIPEAKAHLGHSLMFCDTVEVPEGPFGVRRKLLMLRAIASRRTYWEHWFHRAAAAKLLRRRLHDFRPDIVHLDSVMLGSYLPMLAGHRTVVTHHNIESDLYAERASVNRFPVRQALRREAQKLTRLELHVTRACTLNIAVSPADEARLRAIAPTASTAIVPNGVDTEYFRPIPGVSETACSLVFAGGMDWYPNARAMEWFTQEVWPRLATHNPVRRLTIVGRRPPPPVVALAAADSRVVATGFVPDVRPYISASSIYVCPIHVGGGTRLKVLDALAMERPLVSTALGVSGLGLMDGVHYLRAETAEQFACQIARLEDDLTLRKTLGGAGRKFVEEHFAWPVVSAAMRCALEERALVVTQ